MKKLLTFAANSEAATGVALLAFPSAVARLLLGNGLTGVSTVVGRVAGIGLFSLGLACWPGKATTRSALRAMTTYSVTVTLYLLYLGVCSEWVGPLLWPAVAIHAVLSLLFVRLSLQPE